MTLWWLSTCLALFVWRPLINQTHSERMYVYALGYEYHFHYCLYCFHYCYDDDYDYYDYYYDCYCYYCYHWHYYYYFIITVIAFILCLDSGTPISCTGHASNAGRIYWACCFRKKYDSFTWQFLFFFFFFLSGWC